VAQRLAELKLLVLAMAGELDTPDFRQITALIGHQVTQVRTVIVPDAGHMVNMEAPEQVTQSLLEFFEVSTK
jgi:pimeloyl-ACP methyl ester carboxylesterase